MLSAVEWGHSLLEYEEDLANFEDEDHMNYAGEFTFRVNETCLNNDHNTFMVAPTDRDAHNPIVVNLKPSDMYWPKKCQYIPQQMKMRRHEKRKEIQRQNKRKGYDDQAWHDWRSSGYGGSSASSSRTWRPK